jgi:hypothetical protein
MFNTHDWIPQRTVDVINVSNAKQRSYFQFNNATFTQYNPGRTVIVGLRGTF